MIQKENKKFRKIFIVAEYAALMFKLCIMIVHTLKTMASTVIKKLTFEIF